MVTGSEWRAEAACRTATRAEISGAYGESHRGGRAVTVPLAARVFAQRYCAECPVTDPCREAGRDEIEGVWGGVYRSRNTGRKQRVNLLDTRRRTA